MSTNSSSRVRTSGILVTHRRVRVTNYENGRKKTRWVNVPLVRPPKKWRKPHDFHTQTPSTSKSRPSDVTDRPFGSATDNVCPENDQGNNAAHPKRGGKTYSENRSQRTSAWEEAFNGLHAAYLGTLSPSTKNCAVCHQHHQNITLCQDCGPTAYFCPECCIKQHIHAPLHFPLIWKGHVYVPFKYTKQLSIPGHVCAGAVNPMEITIFDQNGREHYVNVVFCSCMPKVCTLLKLGLWPATPTNPVTAVHLRLMELCRLMLLQGAMAVNKFASTINMYSSTLPSYAPTENLYRTLSSDCAAYHRRFSYAVEYFQGVIPGYPDGTTCPICTETAEVLPKIVSMDGNFRLVRRLKAGTSDVPPYHENHFFLTRAETEPFLKLEPLAHNQECSNFEAGDAVRSKFKSKKLDVTGVFGSMCVHDLPGFFIDMTSGEKLGYAVSIMHKLLQMDETRDLKILYDIACRILPQMKRAKLDCKRIDLAVPLFHGYAHLMKCQTLLNPKNIPGFRLTDGENTERLWSYMGQFVYITREMTPSNRRDLLVDALLHWAKKSLRAAVPKMVQRLQNAKDLKSKTKADLDELTSPLKKEGVDVSAGVVKQWEKKLKERYTSDTTKVPDTPWQEEYAVLLNTWFSLRWRTVDVPLGEKEIEAKAELKRMDEKLQKIEKRQKIVRWTDDSPAYKLAIKTACDKRVTETMQNLYKHSSDRKQWVVKKSQARCHQTAAKHAGNIKKANSKIQGLVKQYNELSGGEAITAEAAKDPSSEIFRRFNCKNDGLPFPECRDICLKSNTLDRIDEERSSIRIEMQSLLKWYKDMHIMLENNVKLINPTSNDEEEGVVSLLLSCLVKNEQHQHELKAELKWKFKIEVTADQNYMKSKIFGSLHTRDIVEEEEEQCYHGDSSSDDDEMPTDEDHH